MNRGARDLRERLDAEGFGARAELARGLGVTRDYVSHWISGDRRPGARYRIKIAALVGTPIEAWDEPVQSKRLRRRQVA